ncbi:MAG: ABC transporter ATP-binding protein [Bacillati bacterium ANGP1]|uniref:ABC transporter ATP-binding protein n=1 Tax=Candidatus Segetimicrobium genomatis TaxID=2569760 RepID=A0A537J4M0_9BACT|nr:MAG: ABC transporter ATP-binding protein [Terrabacteria group bacterium ANGP1]
MALLALEDLRVEYRTARGTSGAVDGVTLEVREGEVLGLVGESGCGKTTLGRAIIRVLPRNARIAGGKIVFDGVDLAALPEAEMNRYRWRSIAMVPQAAMDSLDPVYRLGDQFTEVLTVTGALTRTDARRRSLDLCDLVGLDRRRLVALALRPRLLLADEPVTALDVVVQHRILKMLRTLTAELSLSVILVTHDISVVAQTCDRMAVMYAGNIVETVPTPDVFPRPRHPYTMGLQNSFPNLLAPQETLIPIEGVPPDLLHPPPGCRFAPRCPFAIDRCLVERPALRELEPGRWAACHRAEEAGALRIQSQEAERWRVPVP